MFSGAGQGGAADAVIIEKGLLPPGSGHSYYVTYRFADRAESGRQIYTKTQSVSADQYAALLKGAVTEVMYPLNRPDGSARIIPEYPHGTSTFY